MSYASRCPFCEKVIASAADRETFRAVVLMHLTKCTSAPSTITYAAAAELADEIAGRSDPETE